METAMTRFRVPVPARTVTALVEHLPRARRVTIEGAGRFPYI